MSESVQTESSEREDLLRFVTYRISRLHPKLNAQAAHILRKHAGLSLVQWRMLAMIKVLGPNVCSSEVIEFATVDKGLFSRNLKAMLSEGLVKGTTDERDQRRLLLSLTPKGEQLYKRTISIMRGRQKHLLHDFTAEETKILMRALEKLEVNAQRRDF